MSAAEVSPVPARPGGRRRTVVAIMLAVAVVATTVVFAVIALRGRWSDARDSVRDADVTLLVIAAAVAVVAMGLFGDRWRAAIVMLGASPRRLDALTWFARGQLGKYVPGGIWHVVGQAELARRGGVDRSVAYPSVAVYTVAVVGCGALLSCVSLLLPGAAGAPWWAVVGGLALTAVALEPHVLRRVLGGRIPAIRTLAVTDVVRYVASCAPIWLAVGATTALVARAIDPRAPIAAVASAAVVSWIVGILTIPAPGGVGVREVAFVAALGSSVEAAPAAAIAVTARLVFVLADLLLVPLVRLLVAVVRRRLAAGGAARVLPHE